MLVLHGIYDNGKIEFEEKNLPKGKTPVEIKLDFKDSQKNPLRKVLDVIEGYHGELLRYSREELHER